jgi:hypothetical protein
MAVSKKRIRPDRLAQVTSPIKYITENGFSIVRRSEIDRSVIDTPKECHFLVQHENGAEREVKVGFAEHLITTLQIRKRIPFSETSPFWVVCAESCLANYLWEKTEYPLDGRLNIDELSPDELMLALHWRDRE